MSALPTELTAGQILAWSKVFLDYTDAVVASIPEDDESLDWRPTDERGGWYFNIREQAMHIADTRHDSLGEVSGTETEADDFCTEFGGTEKPWQFRNASRDEILARLKSGRELMDAWLAKPLSEVLETTPSLIVQYEKVLAQLREAGQDTTAREARGPNRIINVLFFISAHEQSHRTVLQAMLRQRGHEVVRYA